MIGEREHSTLALALVAYCYCYCQYLQSNSGAVLARANELCGVTVCGEEGGEKEREKSRTADTFVYFSAFLLLFAALSPSSTSDGGGGEPPLVMMALKLSSVCLHSALMFAHVTVLSVIRLSLSPSLSPRIALCGTVITPLEHHC